MLARVLNVITLVNYRQILYQHGAGESISNFKSWTIWKKIVAYFIFHYISQLFYRDTKQRLYIKFPSWRAITM